MKKQGLNYSYCPNLFTELSMKRLPSPFQFSCHKTSKAWTIKKLLNSINWKKTNKKGDIRKPKQWRIKEEFCPPLPHHLLQICPYPPLFLGPHQLLQLYFQALIWSKPSNWFLTSTILNAKHENISMINLFGLVYIQCFQATVGCFGCEQKKSLGCTLLFFMFSIRDNWW